MAWFGYLAFLHHRRPEKLWAIYVRKMKRHGLAVEDPNVPSAAWLANARRRGTFFMWMAVVTAVMFAAMASNLSFFRR